MIRPEESRKTSYKGPTHSRLRFKL